MAYYNTFALRL